MIKRIHLEVLFVEDFFYQLMFLSFFLNILTGCCLMKLNFFSQILITILLLSVANIYRNFTKFWIMY